MEESKGSRQKQGGVIDTQTTEAESQSVAAGGLNTVNVENEDEEMLKDDALSQFSDTVSNEHQQSYSVQEINHFLDKSYGRQLWRSPIFFPDVDRFINSVVKIRKQVCYEQLNKQKVSS